jgi:hypothetical protein
VPYTEYSIRVQAVNENGPGAFSKDIMIRTHSAQPTQPPHNVTLEAASSTVILAEYHRNNFSKIQNIQGGFIKCVFSRVLS